MTAMPSPIEAARRRHCLAEVATRTGIWLTKHSGRVTVRCPMPSHGHPDSTPSLRLYLDQGIWYCFACSDRAGDVVQWVQQTEGVGWREAIEILDSGRPLSNAWAGAPSDTGWRGPTSPSVELADPQRTPRPKVQEVLEAAWRHASAGPLHARAVAYLAGRGIDVSLLESYNRRAEVGHTPTYGPGLAQRLLAAGFSPTEVVDAGIAYRREDGQLVDFYRHRVLVPVRDHSGQLAGFVGRNVGDPRWPKYKNPPKTATYDKSVNLYQPLPAPNDPSGRVVVVEGTLDAMAIAVAAIKSGVAHRLCPVTQSGRELSETQLERVLALHPNPPVLAFDADPAGRESNLRLERRLKAHERPFSVAWLPEGQDPASVVARLGPQALAWFYCPPPIHRLVVSRQGPATGPAPTWSATL